MLKEAIQHISSMSKDAARACRRLRYIAADRLKLELLMENTQLLFCDEALRCIERIDDPVTKRLINMAFTRFVKKAHIDNDFPAADFDMLYLVHGMKELFSEHEVIARTLAGEKVGAFFDDAN